MKKLDVSHTSALQSAVRHSNKEVSAYSSFWRNLLGSGDYNKVQTAQKLVRAEYQQFVAKGPSAENVDQVRGWILDNAKDAPALLERIDAGY